MIERLSLYTHGEVDIMTLFLQERKQSAKRSENMPSSPPKEVTRAGQGQHRKEHVLPQSTTLGMVGMEMDSRETEGHPDAGGYI